MKLDRTEQRIIGVMIEKQLTVPDTYPLSENALLDGCNQKNNRDPVTELVAFQISGALMALQQQDVVAKVDGGGRVARFRHKLDEVLHISRDESTVLAELLLRGPQAPGALKPRVARMGYHAAPESIEALLQQLAGRAPALVEQLPMRPREQARRWRHRIGDGSELQATAPAASPSAPTAPAAARPAAPSLASNDDCVLDLLARVEVLEQQVRALLADRRAPG